LFKAFFKQNLLRTLVPSIIRLHFIGVGFRVESLTEKVLSLKIGYSHLVHINIPKNIKVIVLKKINIILSSSNDQAVTEFASILRSHRFPDIFKGKGLLFKDEKILLKESKSK
jgi:large subunit ribosomal protein L6